MLVVPLERDIIKTVDGQFYHVISYTNYKENGPAVYVKSKGTKDIILVYFFDIDTINDTKVEFLNNSKIFKALGKIDRIYHLPQPDDKIVIETVNNSFNEDNIKEVEVIKLKLKSKLQGISKGLLIKGDDNNYYRLNQILDINRSIGGEIFNRKKFLEYYKDYTGV